MMVSMRVIEGLQWGDEGVTREGLEGLRGGYAGPSMGLRGGAEGVIRRVVSTCANRPR